MDPSLFAFGKRLMMPIDEEALGGGGSEETELEEVEEEEESESEEEEGESEAEDGEDEEEDESEEEEDESEEDADEGGDLSQRTQKRIKKLLSEKKELARELEETRKLSGKDGEAIISAARKAGILPRLMTKELAEGLDKLDRNEKALNYFQDLLDGYEDEFEIGGKQYSRRQLEREESKLKDEIRDIKTEFGDERSKVLKETKELFELGMAAKRAGWKPGKKAEASKLKKEKPAKGGKLKQAKAKNGRIDFSAVEDEEGLEAAIMAMNRKRN